MNTVAIIPARGGSKGIKKKNIKLFNGKPLINWTIEVALQCSCIDRVIVSTDSEEIADIAKSAGAEAPFLRPADIAQDTTSDMPVLEHVARFLEENEGVRSDIIIYLRPTQPLRIKEDIEGAHELFTSIMPDWVRSICDSEYHPYWMKVMHGNELAPFVSGKSEQEYYQRQLLPPAYRINGLVDITKYDTIINKKLLYGGDVRGFLTPVERSLDIDSELDFKVAEFVFAQTMH